MKCENLRCTKEGLTAAAAQERLAIVGHNKLEEKKCFMFALDCCWFRCAADCFLPKNGVSGPYYTSMPMKPCLLVLGLSILKSIILMIAICVAIRHQIGTRRHKQAMYAHCFVRLELQWKLQVGGKNEICSRTLQ